MSHSTATIADWEQEIRQLEERNRAAFLAADLPVLDELWSDDFLVNSPLQAVNDKPRLMTLLASGRIRHASHVIEIEYIRRSGDVVVVMGNDRVTDPPDGVLSRRRFTNVWQRAGDRWRCIARHAHVVSREPAEQQMPSGQHHQ